MYPFLPVKYGDKGIHVYLCQLALKMLQFRGEDGIPLKIDGHCGDNTLYAINSFQRTEIAYGFDIGTKGEVDGCFGKGCWSILGVFN